MTSVPSVPTYKSTKHEENTGQHPGFYCSQTYIRGGSVECKLSNVNLPSALGVLVVTVLKILTSTRKRVTSSAILPGMTSGGTTKLIQETTTNKPVVKDFPWR